MFPAKNILVIKAPPANLRKDFVFHFIPKRPGVKIGNAHRILLLCAFLSAIPVAIPKAKCTVVQMDPFDVVDAPCEESSDAYCTYVDCGLIGFEMTCDFDDLNGLEGDESGGGGSGGGCPSGDCENPCDADGANPISVHNGNVRRKIIDLPASPYGVPLLRFHNSRGASGNERAVFGTAGHWRHSWQFNLISGSDPGGKAEVFNFRYPSGRRVALWRTGDLLRAPDGQPSMAW